MDDEKGKWIRSGAITIVLAVAFAFLVYWGWERQNEAEQERMDNQLLNEEIERVRENSTTRIDQLLVYAEGQAQEIKQLVAENATFRTQLRDAGILPHEIGTRPTIDFLPEGEDVP